MRFMLSPVDAETFDIFTYMGYQAYIMLCNTDVYF